MHDASFNTSWRTRPGLFLLTAAAQPARMHSGLRAPGCEHVAPPAGARERGGGPPGLTLAPLHGKAGTSFSLSTVASLRSLASQIPGARGDRLADPGVHGNRLVDPGVHGNRLADPGVHVETG